MVVLAAFPACARGATVTAAADEVTDGVAIRDATGEPNALTVRARDETVSVRERAEAPLQAGQGCSQRGAQLVVCDVPTDHALGIDVRLGAGADALSLSEAHSSFLEIQVHGGPGADMLAVETSRSAGPGVFGDSGRDVLRGGGEPDALEGGAGRDQLFGGAGRDSLVGDESEGQAVGDDILDGGEDSDTAAWEGRRSPVYVDLAAGTGGARGEHDRLRSVENASGGGSGDRLAGDGGDNILSGGPGTDSIIGRGGNDRIGAGSSTQFVAGGPDGRADRLRCGPGRDRVVEVDKDVLPPGCELLAASAGVPLNGASIHAHPRTRKRGVEVQMVCDPAAASCRRRITLRSGHRVLGRSAPRSMAPDERTWIFVPLAHPLPRGRPIVVVVTGSDEFGDEGDPYSYGFSWRIRR
jgi:Ca2+-binding RTX toxin-like protein